jgi:hypothetical protein
MSTREYPNAPILYDDTTNQITGLKHPTGGEMPLGSGAVQNIPYAATITPALAQRPIVVVGTLTGAITVANPSSVPPAGQEVSFHFQQDATGSRAVTWGNQYVFPTAWSNTAAANTASSITFVSNGTKLHAKGGNLWS